MTIRRVVLLALGLALVSAAPLWAQKQISGAGATFPQPIYLEWADAYNKATGV